MKRILLFSTLIVLLASCGKEDDLQPKSAFLDDLLGVYIGNTQEVTEEEIVTFDADGNVIDVERILTDTMYMDTIEIITQPVDSTFSFISDGVTVGPLKWNEDSYYTFTFPRQGVDLEIQLTNDDVAGTLDLIVHYFPSSDVSPQANIIRKIGFFGTRQ